MKERVIFHCDANSFYASVEIANNPELLGKPVAVAGNPEKRTGIILTRSTEAKKYGIKTGEAIWQAKQKCPSLICVAPNHKLYEDYSLKLRAIYEKYTDRVESFGIDECWLDMTDSLKFFGDKKTVADKIRKEVKDALGITISVGVSFGKLLAKLGSDLKKPDATTILWLDNYKDIVYPLPIKEVIGIGNKLEYRYHKIGVYTLGDIIAIPDNILKKNFGILGLQLKQKLLGNDDEIVRKSSDNPPPKSIGNGTTTIKDVYTKPEVKAVVIALTEEISTRLRNQNFNAGSISVTLKTADFNYFNEAARLPFATNTASDLTNTVMNLIDTFWNYGPAIRSVRICTYNLTSSKETQLNMFSGTVKNSKLNSALDQIRSKYGYYSITPLSTLASKTLDKTRIEV